jgi:PiT family inorganic phosphate transporter
LYDTPKIVALGAVASAALGVSGLPFYAAVALAMAAGSIAGGKRVTQTLACRVTAMSATEGFSANLVTTLLVCAASVAALPVSTTHVSSSAAVVDSPGARQSVEDRHRHAPCLGRHALAGLVGAGAYALLARVSDAARAQQNT